MPTPAITNKKQMYRLWKQGAFGNKVQHWESLDAFVASSYDGRCGFRSTTIGSPNYGIFSSKQELLQNLPVTNEQLVFSEGTYDNLVLVQGELTRATFGVYLYYSTEKLMMRDALKNGMETAIGARVHTILRYFCDPSSYEDLVLLLDMYPDHIIEFSTFSKNLGVIPHRNTVVWEVRKY